MNLAAGKRKRELKMRDVAKENADLRLLLAEAHQALVETLDVLPSDTPIAEHVRSVVAALVAA